MKGSLLLPVLVGSVAAQHMTLPFVDNALDPADGGSIACSLAQSNVQNCVLRLDSDDGSTISGLTAVAKCACCAGDVPIVPAYSSCAAYLSKNAPTSTSQYSAFAKLYTLCNMNDGLCSGSGSPATGVSPGAEPSSGAVTSSALVGSFPPACTSMVGLFESCTNDVPGFASLPYSRQAPCYCCATARGQASWIDDMDKYAKTCRDWARTSGPQSVYSVAKVYAGFCKKFTDACSPGSTLGLADATTTSTDAEATGDRTSRTVSTLAAFSTGAAPNQRAASLAGFFGAAAFALAF